MSARDKPALIFASAMMLLMATGASSVLAQTFGEAVTAYERGDYATALVGFRSHAEQGLAKAQLNLGVMYDNGEGVPQDDVKSYAWISIAAAQGLAKAKEDKKLVTKRMSQAQIAQAQRQSRDYWQRHVVPFLGR